MKILANLMLHTSRCNLPETSQTRDRQEQQGYETILSGKHVAWGCGIDILLASTWELSARNETAGN